MAWNTNLTLERNTEHYVCTALVLSGFGERTVDGNDEIGESVGHAPNLGAFKAHLRYCVEQHDENVINPAPYFDDSVHRTAVIQAYTIHTQPVSEGYLKELGFQQFGPVEKEKHPASKLSVWLIRTQDFLEAIKE